ncbi:hypothetical protein GCM10023321_23210 [Pseudonocardia eucalypti]|uniref:Uncharacterized protein n=1 Tax=Pseudonocardia eucalypti TaxID=648755 RepID=A0ABP9PYP4_9PSEU
MADGSEQDQGSVAGEEFEPVRFVAAGTGVTMAEPPETPRPWRAVVYFVDKDDNRTGRATFLCADAGEATERAKVELEERRRDHGRWLGGPTGLSAEAKIVAPDRRIIGRFYLFSEHEPLTWDPEDPDNDEWQPACRA